MTDKEIRRSHWEHHLLRIELRRQVIFGTPSRYIVNYLESVPVFARYG